MSVDNEREAQSEASRRPGRRIVSIPTSPTRSSGGARQQVKGARPKPSAPPPGAGPFAQPDPREGAPGRRRPQTAPKSPERIRWEQATDGVSSVHGRPFDPERVYTEGDIILHKQFGMGVVEQPAADGASVRVLFREGVETLELTPIAES